MIGNVSEMCHGQISDTILSGLSSEYVSWKTINVSEMHLKLRFDGFLTHFYGKCFMRIIHDLTK